MNISEQMQNKLQKLNPEYIEIINQSHMHSGDRENSHFKIILVSPEFTNLSHIERHQKVHEILKEEISQIHAITLTLKAPGEELKEKITPPCTKK